MNVLVVAYVWGIRGTFMCSVDERFSSCITIFVQRIENIEDQ